MIAENWDGVMAPIGQQIKAMLGSVNINPSQCPLGPLSIDIHDYTITLPKPPAILSFLAAVRIVSL